MTLLVISDDESCLSRLPETRADVLISCGDLPEETVLFAARRCQSSHIFAVKGNHDSNAPFTAPIADLHLKTHSIGGMTFGGFGGAWKYKPRGHHLYEQAQVEAALSAFPPVDIFVAHNSPRHIHDRDDEIHLGFTAFNSYMDRTRPRWLLHGHQHRNREALVGTTQVIGTYGHRVIVVPE